MNNREQKLYFSKLVTPNKELGNKPMLTFIFTFFVSVLLANNSNNYQLNFVIQKYNHDVFNKVISRSEAEKQNIQTQTGLWEVDVDKKEIDAQTTEYNVKFRLLKGFEKSVAAMVEFQFNHWNKQNYVLLPAAAYNGNRFEARQIAYSPKLNDARDIGNDKPIIITDVPRLNIHEGVSHIQERSGSMASPSFGFHAPNNKRGFFLTFPQQNALGDYGISIEENRDRSKANIRLSSPLVREQYRYHMCNNSYPSTDKPGNFEVGDTISFAFRTYRFQSEAIQSIFDYYVNVRKDFCAPPAFDPIMTFSNCFDVLEKKFNSYNFVPQWGYYSVGGRNMFLQDWQIGWTGGMISTYPLLFMGQTQTKQNVVANFNWLFPKGISPSGFFWDSGEKGNQWYGGDIRKPQSTHWHLIRKSGDGLYYILKQFHLMQKQGISIKPEWENGTRTVADAFVRLWKNNKQFGQFVDSRNGQIAVGGSTSAGIAPAALAMAAKYYNNAEYFDIAIASAQWMYDNYIAKGIACGGPGDALQNPDSESWYALLESFAVLYDLTRNPKWLTYSIATAHQLSTWVMSYDYIFPTTSLFGQMNMKATGAVFANTQNKHGSPGICTHSGLAFLRLYRNTNNALYLQLLKEIAHSIPQYMSTDSRPIKGLESGWINERVSTTDWFEGIGEVFPGSTWAETALLLSIVELPGIYVDIHKKLAIAFDHVDVELLSSNKNSAKLRIRNRTQQNANVSYLVENEKSKTVPWQENSFFAKQTIEVKAKSSIIITLKMD